MRKLFKKSLRNGSLLGGSVLALMLLARHFGDNLFRKNRSGIAVAAKKAGFTLTEVLIGITILTIAIVSATNLLISLINTNEANVKSLQAYYLAQEGIEAVRNIRDSNWLHNRDWLSGDENSSQIWGDSFEFGQPRNILLKPTWTLGNQNSVGDGNGGGVDEVLALVSEAAPFKLVSRGGKILKNLDAAAVYLGSVAGGEETGFEREVRLEEFDQCGLSDCRDYVLVTSLVTYGEGFKTGRVELKTILTDWQ